MELIETIKCKNGLLFNLRYHQSRFNAARLSHFPSTKSIDLSEHITIPEECKTGLFRCRIVYAEKIKRVEFLLHQFRDIKSLKLVEDNQIHYQHKYSNRDRLHYLFQKRGNCDDILILKNACITDSYTANVVFYDGQKWWTPDTPLLPGTQRARLIEEGKIQVARITRKDIFDYKKAGLINAMWDLENMPQIRIQDIQ